VPGRPPRVLPALAATAGVAAGAVLLLRPRSGVLAPVPVQASAYFTEAELARARGYARPQLALFAARSVVEASVLAGLVGGGGGGPPGGRVPPPPPRAGGKQGCPQQDREQPFQAASRAKSGMRFQRIGSTPPPSGGRRWAIRRFNGSGQSRKVRGFSTLDGMSSPRMNPL
jgi:hypothetical protein